MREAVSGEARQTPPAGPEPVSTDQAGIAQILRTAVQEGASDLHFKASEPVLVRIKGNLLPLKVARLTPEATEKIFEALRPRHLAQVAGSEVQELDFSFALAGIGRFRVNAFRQRGSLALVIRVIPNRIPEWKELNLPPVLPKLADERRGLMLVTGTTGSGKSTTLAAMVDWINKNRNDHIITIEDPVEFVHETRNCLVNQREVHADTASFSAALRAALREDPDIVLVGEMRDLETISIAIETAETGHLVFGTLHTTTAVSTVDRIIDQFPTDRQQQVRVMLSESMRGVIAQTLCKKKGGGRVAALEILVGSNAVSNLIREGKTFQIPSLMQTQKAAGMQTLNDSLFQLVKDGLVEPDDAFSKSVDRTSFKMMLERAGIKLEGH
jgi:twitching motility protein PilT